MEIVRYIVLGLYVIVCVALIILATIQAKDSQIGRASCRERV